MKAKKREENEEKGQGNKVKESDKTQLFVNGVKWNVVGAEWLRAAKRKHLLFNVAFSAIFSNQSYSDDSM